MKRLSTILLLFILSGAFALMAQVRDPKFKRELLLGVKAGVSIPNIEFSPAVAQNAWVGYTTGFSFRYTEEKLFGLIIEANFTRRGWDENFDDDPYNYRRSLDYLEIPFLAHIYFGSDKIHGFVNLGPQLGVLINEAKISNFDVSNPPSFSNYNKVKEAYDLPIKNIFDYGITGGLGAELRLNKHIIVLEGRYYFGLGDIFGNRKADVFSGSSANRGFLVTLSYMFNIW